MLRIVPHTVPRVGRSYEHFSDGVELHLLPPALTRSLERLSDALELALDLAWGSRVTRECRKVDMKLHGKGNSISHGASKAGPLKSFR